MWLSSFRISSEILSASCSVINRENASSVPLRRRQLWEAIVKYWESEGSHRQRGVHRLCEKGVSECPNFIGRSLSLRQWQFSIQFKFGVNETGLSRKWKKPQILELALDLGRWLNLLWLNSSRYLLPYLFAPTERERPRRRPRHKPQHQILRFAKLSWARSLLSQVWRWSQSQ